MDRLMIFLRAPEPGRVKTRMASGIPSPKVVLLYRAMVKDVMAAARASGCPIELWVDPPGTEPAIAHWLGNDLTILPQSDGTIGQRMATAFQHAFKQGIHRAVLLGTDIPGISAENVRDAFRRLTDHPVVLGPTLDGGYGLIGLTPRVATIDLFTGIDWGSSRVLAQTLKRLLAADQPWSEIEPLHDLDTPDDLVTFGASDRHQGTHTARCIHQLGLGASA